MALNEVQPRIAGLSMQCTCQCGKAFATSAALAVHRTQVHGYLAATSFYAEDDHLCTCCLVQFGCRRMLISHLAQKSPLCLLNCLLRLQPLSAERELLLRTEDREKNPSGKSAHAAFRVYGPTWNVMNLDGQFLHGLHRDHPAGSGRGKRYMVRHAPWDVEQQRSSLS